MNRSTRIEHTGPKRAGDDSFRGDRRTVKPVTRKLRRAFDKSVTERDVEAWQCEVALFQAQLQEEIDGRKGIQA